MADLSEKLASRSRTSLCLMIVNPPAWSMVDGETRATGTFSRQMGGAQL